MTIEELEKRLGLASEEELVLMNNSIERYFVVENPNASIDELHAGALAAAMIDIEAERRPIEPLWRKAKRYALRNAGEIGKVAAGVAVGTLLGISIDG